MKPIDYFNHAWLEEFVRDCKKVIAASPTELRYTHNLAIFERWVALWREYEEHGNICWWLEQIEQDFELFCLTHLRPDNGLPEFLTNLSEAAGEFNTAIDDLVAVLETAIDLNTGTAYPDTISQ